MQINASSANSINFIEQKKSNTSSSNLKDNSFFDKKDSFVGKTSTSSSLLELNESLGMLQIAGDTILQLKSHSEELQKLTQKYTDFQSQKLELNEQFEKIAIKMLDIVDNTMIKDRQLFYTTHIFITGSQELELTMQNDYEIEDLNLLNDEEINVFDTKLINVEKQISEIKKQIEIANFNQMAALDKNSPLLDIKRNNTSYELELSVEDIKRAHDINSLKDKVGFLLAD